MQDEEKCQAQAAGLGGRKKAEMETFNRCSTRIGTHIGSEPEELIRDADKRLRRTQLTLENLLKRTIRIALMEVALTEPYADNLPLGTQGGD